MANDRDILYLTLIGEAIADIRRRFTNLRYDAYFSDRDEQALAAFRLSIIGENSNKLSSELKRYIVIFHGQTWLRSGI